MGVGKTRLARRICKSLGGALVLEKSGENPFLEKFYRNPEQHALQTQLYFLFQRIRRLRELLQSDLFIPSVRISNFMFERDPLYARLTLSPEEYRLYEQVFQLIKAEAPTPDLVIYLQAPLEILVSRIRRRGILYERNMKREYLEQLSESYARFFLGYNRSPLLVVNAENPGLQDSDETMERLMDEILSISSGRHYFNPFV